VNKSKLSNYATDIRWKIYAYFSLGKMESRFYDPDLYIVSIDDNNGETLQAHRSVLNNFPKVNTHSHRYL